MDDLDKMGWTLFIETKLKRDLEILAKKRRRSCSSIVNELLENYLKQKKDEK